MPDNKLDQTLERLRRMRERFSSKRKKLPGMSRLTSGGVAKFMAKHRSKNNAQAC